MRASGFAWAGSGRFGGHTASGRPCSEERSGSRSCEAAASKWPDPTVQRIAQLNPDVLTLDVEMPEMDGLACCGESGASIRTCKVSDHVQHAHRARRSDNSQGLDSGRRRLCDQGVQRRFTRSLDGAFAGRTASQDQTVFPSGRRKPGCSSGTRRNGSGAAKRAKSLRAHLYNQESVAIGVSTGGPDCVGCDTARDCRRISRCRSSSCSTCRLFSHDCWPNGFTPCAGCQSKKPAKAPT